MYQEVYIYGKCVVACLSDSEGETAERRNKNTILFTHFLLQKYRPLRIKKNCIQMAYIQETFWRVEYNRVYNMILPP